jgi:DNA-binding NarL/FixJ family response regulator
MVCNFYVTYPDPIHVFLIDREDHSLAPLQQRLSAAHIDFVVNEISMTDMADLPAGAFEGAVVLLDYDVETEEPFSERVRKIWKEGARVIAVSGNATPAFMARAMAAGADAAVSKSDSARRVAHQIQLAFVRNRMAHT